MPDVGPSGRSDGGYERVLRGIPRWLLKQYLESLGGREIAAPEGEQLTAEEYLLAADRWQARLTQIEDYRIGSLRSGQVRMTVTGDGDAVQAMLAALEPRLFRGGG